MDYRINKRLTKEWAMINDSVSEFINTLNNPFGSFEKATYLIYRYNGDVLYSFTTTCHNTEESIELMKEYYHSIWNCYLPKSFKIWKRVNGVQEIIYEKVYYRSYGV
jgi:hypothetical protein